MPKKRTQRSRTVAVKKKRNVATRSSSRLWGAAGEGRGKRERLSQRKKRTRLVMLAAAPVVVLILVLGVAWGSHQQALLIQGVSVSGTQMIRAEAVQRVAESALRAEGFQLFARDNTFLYPKETIQEHILAEFPRAKKVNIRATSFANAALAVSIVEREPFARWCKTRTNERCYMIDEDGVIFAKADGKRVPYTFRGGVFAEQYEGAEFLPTRFHAIVQTLDAFRANGISAKEFSVLNEHDFEITTEAGLRLRGDFAQDIAFLLDNAKTVLNSEELKVKRAQIDYVDLRFGNRVYYKLRN